MTDLNKKDVEILHKFLNKFLRTFETDPLEKKFWNDTYSLDELCSVRNKLGKSLKDA